MWDDLVSFIENKTGDSFDLTNYQKMFGLEVEDSEQYNAINFWFLYFKFYIHRKFRNNSPSFQAYKNLTQIKINSKYKIAESKGILSKHLKTFSFDLGF